MACVWWFLAFSNEKADNSDHETNNHGYDRDPWPSCSPFFEEDVQEDLNETCKFHGIGIDKTTAHGFSHTQMLSLVHSSLIGNSKNWSWEEANPSHSNIDQSFASNNSSYFEYNHTYQASDGNNESCGTHPFWMTDKYEGSNDTTNDSECLDHHSAIWNEFFVIEPIWGDNETVYGKEQEYE